MLILDKTILELFEKIFKVIILKGIMKNFKRNCLRFIVLSTLVFSGFGCNGKFYVPAERSLDEGVIYAEREEQNLSRDSGMTYFNLMSYVYE